MRELRSHWPSGPGQEEAGMLGTPVPSIPTRRQLFKAETVASIIWFYVTFLELLSFELFD